jgi:actin-related protein
MVLHSVGQMGMGIVMQQDDVISDFTMFVLDCGKQHASVTKILQEQAV